jgi:hypothetical protein
LARTATIRCVPLMDPKQIGEYTAMNREAPSPAQRTIVEALLKDRMGDPAERAILANIILGSLPELLELPAKEINLRTIHDTYTRRWISQEDGKGLFRLLTNPEKRHDFLGWLALEMHFTNSLDISDHDLGRAFRAHFGPTTTHEVDHFNHDVGTCPFLQIDDAGNYHFIDTSLMEYFVAREFSRLAASVCQGPFKRFLTNGMIELLVPDALPEELQSLFLMRDIAQAVDSALTGSGSKRFCSDLGISFEKFICDHWPRYDKTIVNCLVEAANSSIVMFLEDQAEQLELIYETYKIQIDVHTKFGARPGRAGPQPVFDTGYISVSISGDEAECRSGRKLG